MTDPFDAPSGAGTADREMLGAPRELHLEDRDVVDDYALRQARLRGALARGHDWRRRAARPVTRRLLGGAIAGVVAVAGVAAVTFVQAQLSRQQAQRDGRVTPVATASAAPGTPQAGAPSPSTVTSTVSATVSPTR